MKLYKLEMLTGAPKASWTNILRYIIADNDEQVYEYLKKNHSYWDEDEDEPKVFDIYDEEYNKTGTETFKEKIIRIKGDANDEDLEWEDAYYGITAYSWVDMGLISTSDIKLLQNLNIVENQDIDNTLKV